MSRAEWRHCKLGDFLEVKHGFAFKGEYFGEVGTHILLTPGNFYDEGGFKDKGEGEKRYSGPVPAEYVLREGDVVIAMTEQAEGLLGSSALVPRSGVYLHNQRIGLLRFKNPTVAHSRFFSYIFNCPWVRAQIRASATGAKIRHTAPGRIAEVKVLVPDLPVQRRIASLLSAYDCLISSNLCRIQILQEMARSIYREWFVYFRFPGHAGGGRLESPLGPIPEGWEVKPVGELVTVIGGGTPSRREPSYWSGAEIQWYAPRDLTAAGTMFMEQSAECITRAGLDQSSARLFPAFSVMMTSRATIGAIAINTCEATTNQGFIICVPTYRVPLIFMYQWLQENVPLFERQATGATFKEISRGSFKTIDFLLPPIAVVERYEQMVKPLADLMLALQRSVENLRTTRNLLLPRLMSGQLTLRGADEAVSAAL